MFYIYALICPITGEVRYIGKTRTSLEQRLYGHLNKAARGVRGHCQNWIRSLLKAGLQPQIEAIIQADDSEDWQALEKATIKAFREAGARLTNMTGGGDGFHNLKPEAVARRVASRAKTLSDPARRASFCEAVQSSWDNNPERLREASERMSEAWGDEQKRLKIVAGMNTPEALAHRGHMSAQNWKDPEYRKRHIAGMIQRWADPEFRERSRASQRKSWDDEGIRNRRIDGILAFYADPHNRETCRLTNREILARPEVRLKIGAASRERWTDEQYRAEKLTHLQSKEFRAAQSDRLKTRWGDPEARLKMNDARWTPEKRREQSEAARRRNKRLGQDPEYVEKRNETLKLARAARWAKHRANKGATT